MWFQIPFSYSCQKNCNVLFFLLCQIVKIFWIFDAINFIYLYHFCGCCCASRGKYWSHLMHSTFHFRLNWRILDCFMILLIVLMFLDSQNKQKKIIIIYINKTYIFLKTIKLQSNRLNQNEEKWSTTWVHLLPQINICHNIIKKNTLNEIFVLKIFSSCTKHFYILNERTRNKEQKWRKIRRN